MLKRDPRIAYETLALRLYVHGLEAANDWTVIRRLAHGPLWLETRILLRSHGFTEAELADLIDLHRRGCPCWACVKRLRLAVARTTRLLRLQKNVGQTRNKRKSVLRLSER